MTNPSDKALAQAFREAYEIAHGVEPIGSEIYARLTSIHNRAREMDAEKGGQKMVAFNEMLPPAKLYATPPAQAAEAVPTNCRERLRIEGKPYPRSHCQSCGKFAPSQVTCDRILRAVTGSPVSVEISDSRVKAALKAYEQAAVADGFDRLETYNRGFAERWMRAAVAAMQAGN